MGVQPPGAGFGEDRGIGDRLGGDAALGQADPRARLMIRGIIERSQGLAQLVEAFAAHRDGRDHGHAERFGQSLRIEHQPVAFGQIHHVERDDGGQAEREQFLREHQMLFDIRGIEHDHQRIGAGLALEFAHHDLAGHFLVGTRRVERIAARQVDQLHRFAGGEDHPARFALDRDAGIIGDLLARAGERVEQRALASIGIAREGDETLRPAHVSCRTRLPTPPPVRLTARGHGRGARPPSSGRR